MIPRQRRSPRRKRVGRVSYYWHHGAWHIYYRDGQRQIRRRAGHDEAAAARVAAEINAQLHELPTMFAFAPLSVAELQQRFLEHHEHVLRSSLATVRRYRAATQHLVNFGLSGGKDAAAHQFDADAFVRHLRELRIAPNGHRNAKPRQLRDKGIRFILETCRSLFGYAAKKRHLPPYAENPFARLGGKRFTVEDAKRIFVFDERSEVEFLKHADDWAFPLHFLLAKTGLRPGEATHLMIEDLDLGAGWLQVRNKPELGWKIKTRRERAVPLIDELVLVLRQVIGRRLAGPVFLRPRFVARPSSLCGADYERLAQEAERRVQNAVDAETQPLSREQIARIHRGVWRDAGAVRADRVRISFCRIAVGCGLSQVTCPKSWRHTFATLLQDGNVDLLVRQITLGHTPMSGSAGALGMTTIYTHTRPETQRDEIFRALHRWPLSLDLARTYAQGGAT